MIFVVYVQNALACVVRRPLRGPFPVVGAVLVGVSVLLILNEHTVYVRAGSCARSRSRSEYGLWCSIAERARTYTTEV